MEFVTYLIKKSATSVDLPMKALNVRDHRFHTVGEFPEDRAASKCSGSSWFMSFRQTLANPE